MEALSKPNLATRLERLRTIFWLASQNLKFKRLRTLLTMAGIIIGLGSIVFLIALAMGLHQAVNRQVLGSRSIKTIDVTSPNAASIQLTQDRANKIGQIANVNSVGHAYILPGKVNFQNSLSDTVVYATDNLYLNLIGLDYVAGHHDLSAPHSALVNTSMLSLLGINSPAKAIGHKLKVTVNITEPNGATKKQVPQDLTVAGVVSTGSGSEVYMEQDPITQAGEPVYSQLKVTANSESAVNVVRQQIGGLGLTTSSPIDTLSEINTFFQFFTFVVIGFGGIGMIVAILGMFNTLTISLLERTSEIGLMISLGARKADVKRLLIAEALLLALIGSAIGIVLAWVVGMTIDVLMSGLAASHGVQGKITIFNVSFVLVIAVLLLSVLIALLVAYYPARRASSINPINALRNE